MSSDNVAIRIDRVSKRYEIYDRPRDRLKQFFHTELFARLSLPSHDYFREFWALRDVSLELGRGQTVGVIGRNGSGKSTLLQLVCGTLSPTSGAIQTAGRVAALLELGSGFNPEFTGRENVFLKASILGLSESQIAERYRDIVEFADIGDFIDQPLKTYSSGMALRLAFSVVAHVDADVLIIDEALSVGDIFFTQKCMRFLRTFIERGTVLFVSHDIGAVRGLCDRVIWLDGGRVIADGAPKEVTERYLTSLMGQAVSGVRSSAQSARHSDAPIRDQRVQRAACAAKGDLEVVVLRDSDAAAGLGGARVESVSLRDLDGNVLSWAVGGEMVKLVIQTITDVSLSGVIVGFQVKDRLGQILFGDNTFLSNIDRPLDSVAGDQVIAEFIFRMPRFARGDYVISAAIASGTQSQHVTHHWLHDGLAFRASGNAGVTGIIGIEMESVTLVRAG